MAIIVLVLIVVIVYKQRQTSKQRKQMKKLQKMLENQSSSPTIFIESQQQHIYNAGFNIIPREALKVEEILGKGEFGKVMKAYWGSNPIAVKELHEKNMDELSNFVKELLTMIQLGYHPNILRVLGAVTENMNNGNLMICMEFCELGSLKQLIKRERNRYIDERTNIDNYYSQTIEPEVWNKLLDNKKNIGYDLKTR